MHEQARSVSGVMQTQSQPQLRTGGCASPVDELSTARGELTALHVRPPRAAALPGSQMASSGQLTLPRQPGVVSDLH